MGNGRTLLEKLNDDEDEDNGGAGRGRGEFMLHIDGVLGRGRFPRRELCGSWISSDERREDDRDEEEEDDESEKYCDDEERGVNEPELLFKK